MPPDCVQTEASPAQVCDQLFHAAKRQSASDGHMAVLASIGDLPLFVLLPIVLEYFYRVGGRSGIFDQGDIENTVALVDVGQIVPADHDAVRRADDRKFIVAKRACDEAELATGKDPSAELCLNTKNAAFWCSHPGASSRNDRLQRHFVSRALPDHAQSSHDADDSLNPRAD